MPEYTVTPRGAPIVSSGSTIATRGIRNGLETPTFSSRSGSEITATGVASDPVPAVVGTATSGTTGPGHGVLAVVAARAVRRASPAAR